MQQYKRYLPGNSNASSYRRELERRGTEEPVPWLCRQLPQHTRACPGSKCGKRRPPPHLSEALTHTHTRALLGTGPGESRLGQCGGMFTRLSACPLNTLSSHQTRHRLSLQEWPSHCERLTCLLPGSAIATVTTRLANPQEE